MYGKTKASMLHSVEALKLSFSKYALSNFTMIIYLCSN